MFQYTNQKVKYKVQMLLWVYFYFKKEKAKIRNIYYRMPIESLKQQQYVMQRNNKKINIKAEPSLNRTYKVELTIEEENNEASLYHICKRYGQFVELEKNLLKNFYDLDICISNMKESSSSAENLERVNALYQQIKERMDIVRWPAFREFMGMPPTSEILEELDRLTICQKSSKLVDCCWDAKHMVMVTLEVPNPTQISTWFKNLLTTNTSLIKLYQLQGKWKRKWVLTPEAEPSSIHYSASSGTLHVVSNIGFFIYNLTIQPSHTQHSLIQFVKQFEVGGLAYGPNTGITYFCTRDKLFMHSLTKEYQMEIGGKFVEITALVLDEGKLYVGDREGVHVLRVEGKDWERVGMVKMPSVGKLILTAGFLFAMHAEGYIGVVELKPNKEHLLNTLTNIDCPSDTKCLAYSSKHHMLITAHQNKIALISTHNEPLYLGGNHTAPISTIIYDAVQNMLLVADQSGEICIYGFCFRF